jgi:septum site-determining protein MinC
MSAAAATRPAFDIKSTVWTLTALRLQVADAAALRLALDQRFAETPGLFEQEPMVIDLSPLREADAAIDWQALLGHLRHPGMAPVGAQGGSDAQMASARDAGLAEVPLALRRAAPAAATPPGETAQSEGKAAAGVSGTAGGTAGGPDGTDRARTDPAAGTVAADAAPDAAAPIPAPDSAGQAAQRMPALVIDKPLRSGQRVYARGGDLVILSVVSHGAEAIADGSIHVYAPLRGRAIAGARGDTTARIFSTCLEPQLVSIAGVYRTTEHPLTPDVLGRPAQVRLEGEKIIVEPLTA